MKKIITAALFFLYCCTTANAQSVNAVQSVMLSMEDHIELSFVATGGETGNLVNLPFTTIANYANGVSSAAQSLKVRSNRNFVVKVKTNANNFSYSGSTSPAPAMPVDGILKVKVTANSTGGTIAAPFSNFATLKGTSQNLIANGSRGGNQTFSVKYKGTPGFDYPAGSYTVDVIYTATQI